MQSFYLSKQNILYLDIRVYYYYCLIFVRNITKLQVPFLLRIKERKKKKLLTFCYEFYSRNLWWKQIQPHWDNLLLFLTFACCKFDLMRNIFYNVFAITIRDSLLLKSFYQNCYYWMDAWLSKLATYSRCLLDFSFLFYFSTSPSCPYSSLACITTKSASLCCEGEWQSTEDKAKKGEKETERESRRRQRENNIDRRDGPSIVDLRFLSTTFLFSSCIPISPSFSCFEPFGCSGAKYYTRPLARSPRALRAASGFVRR